MLIIGILEGDDIGLEVVPECVKVMKAAAAKTGLEVDWQPLLIGSKGHQSHGHTVPQVTLDALAKVDGWIQGPIGHNAYPRNDPTWINPPLRKMFELFASVKPVKSYPNLPSVHKNVDKGTFLVSAPGFSVVSEGVARATEALLRKQTDAAGAQAILVKYVRDLLGDAAVK